MKTGDAERVLRSISFFAIRSNGLRLNYILQNVIRWAADPSDENERKLIDECFTTNVRLGEVVAERVDVSKMKMPSQEQMDNNMARDIDDSVVTANGVQNES